MNRINNLQVFLALRNLPSGQVAGGPIAAARLLGEALIEYKSLWEGSIKVAFLEEMKIRPLEDLLTKGDDPGILSRKRMWDLLVTHPNSLCLNMLHSLSLDLKSFIVAQRLHHTCSKQRTVIQSFIPNLSYVLAKPRSRAYKVVHSDHSKGGWSREYSMMYPSNRKSRLVRRMKMLEAEVAEYCDIIVFPSRGAYDLFRELHCDLVQIPHDKVQILYTGVPDWLLKCGSAIIGKGPKIILNVAHHVPEKRIDRYVKAVDVFLKKVGGAKRDFVAVNYGRFTSLTKALSKHTEVRFNGLVTHDELIKEMSKCWVLVSVPEVSVFELVILEAMSLGKPIIASKVGGNIEALGDDYPLYASEPEEIADILLELETNKELYEQVSKRNRERYLQLFTLEAFVRRHIDLWQKLSQE